MSQSPLHVSRYSQQARDMRTTQRWEGTGGLGADMQGMAEPVRATTKKFTTPPPGSRFTQRIPYQSLRTRKEFKKTNSPTRVVQYPRMKANDVTIAKPNKRSWKGLLGIAETTYPHPIGETFI